MAGKKASAASKAAPIEAATAKKASPLKSAAAKAATTAKGAATTAAAARKATMPSANMKGTGSARPAVAQAAPDPETAAAGQAPPPVVALRLRVKGNERPWTVKELKDIRAEIEEDIARLTQEIAAAESDLAGLMRDAGDGAGDDQADAGTKTFEREQEISVANNSREMLEQSEHALERILDGSYGICESCGNAVGKLRLQAFPRATLCVTCKQKQERR